MDLSFDMENNIKLLKCPFCSSDKVRVYRWSMSSYWSVSCGDNKCPMNHVLDNLFETEEAATIFWNTRFGQKFDESLHIKQEID